MSSPMLHDARGRAFAVGPPPRRIVSLVPSQTELLSDLGLDEEVVGLTRFCVRPSGWKERKQIVGGTKNADPVRILALRPELVLANLEENTRELIEQLDRELPVYVTDVRDLPRALDMIETVGLLVGRLPRARRLRKEIEEGFARFVPLPPLRTVYLIWRRPWMAAGRETFIDDMLARAGLRNVVAAPRYPELSDEALHGLHPELLLLSSEPYPFAARHVTQLQAMIPGARVLRVDGEAFSWYGSRLRHTPSYVQGLGEELAS